MPIIIYLTIMYYDYAPSLLFKIKMSNNCPLISYCHDGIVF